MDKVATAKPREERPPVELRVKSKDGCDRIVHMPADEYDRLIQGEVIVKRLEDFTEEEIEAMLNQEIPAEAYLYNHEVE